MPTTHHNEGREWDLRCIQGLQLVSQQASQATARKVPLQLACFDGSCPQSSVATGALLDAVAARSATQLCLARRDRHHGDFQTGEGVLGGDVGVLHAGALDQGPESPQVSFAAAAERTHVGRTADIVVVAGNRLAPTLCTFGNDRADHLPSRLNQVDDHIQQVDRFKPQIGHEAVRIQILARARRDQDGRTLLAAVAAQEEIQVDDPDQRRHAGHGCGYQWGEMKQVLKHVEADPVESTHVITLILIIALEPLASCEAPDSSLAARFDVTGHSRGSYDALSYRGLHGRESYSVAGRYGCRPGICTAGA